MFNADTGALLATQDVTGFSAGQYLCFNAAGDVTFRITNNGGVNAVLSGLFIDPAKTYRTSYSANYYDDANRETATENVGTTAAVSSPA
jgi:hypothetical protein